MIIMTFPSKPFQLNAKGAPRRAVILKQYEEEIEELYRQIEDSSQSDLPAPSVWDQASTLSFVRAVVEQTLRRTIADDDDIFRNGGDRYAPITSFWFRGSLLRHSPLTVCKRPISATP